MKLRKDRTLFISHKANRTGAPGLLLGIITEYKKLSEDSIQILIMEDGPLTEDFRKLAPTFLWPQPRKNENIVRSTMYRVSHLAQAFLLLFKFRKSTLVFSNTVSNGHIHKKLLFTRSKFVCYVHELENVIKAITSPKSLQLVLGHTDFFMAGSNAVRENLISKHAVKPEKVKVVYSTLPVLSRHKNDFRNEITAFRNKSRIPSNAIVIGAAAASEWRKGFDLFFPLVKLYFQQYPESQAHFVWLGVTGPQGANAYLLSDFQKFGITERVTLVEAGKEYLEIMASFDIHLLPAREDPFPLVMLDAATFGIPTVCFAQSGGIPEFVEEDCGFCVPYGDLLAMADKLNLLTENETLRKQLGSAARIKVGANHKQSDATRKIIEELNQLS